MSRRNRGGRKRYRAEAEAARAARDVAKRAARRLDILEWVMLLGAAALSAAAGALVGFLGEHLVHFSFRITWVVSSLVIFAVPGWFAMRRAKREDAALRAKIMKQIKGSDG